MKPLMDYLRRLGPKRAIAWWVGVLLLVCATAWFEVREARVENASTPAVELAPPVELATLETSTCGGAADQVVSVAFAPDGLSFASFNRDGAIRIWEADSGRLRSTLETKAFPLAAGTISPDGKTAAVGYEDGTVQWWNLVSGEHAGTVKLGPELVEIALKSGGLFAKGAQSPTIKLFSGVNAKGTGKFPDRRGRPFSAMAVAPRGNILALAEEDDAILLWDLTTGKQLAILEGNPDYGPVSRLEFSKDGSKLVSYGADQMIKVWEVASKEGHPATPPLTFRDMACSHDVTTIATLGFNSEVRVFDSATRRLLWEETGLPMSADCIALSPDGKKVVVGGSETLLRFWNTATSRQRARLRIAGSITSAALTPTGEYLAAQITELARYTVKAWNVNTGTELPIKPQGEWIAAPSFTGDGTRLVMGDIHGTIAVWDVRNGLEIEKFPQDPKPGRAILATALTADGKILATGGPRAIRLWDMVTKKELPHSPISVYAEAAHVVLAVAPDSATLASLLDEQALCVWNVSSGKELMRVPPLCFLHSLALTPDGSILATGGEQGALQLWDTSLGRVRTTIA